MTRAAPSPTTSRRGLFTAAAAAGLTAASAAPAAGADVLEFRRLDAEALHLARAVEATPDDAPDYEARVAAASAAMHAAEDRILTHPGRGLAAAWARARSCLRHARLTQANDLVEPLQAIVADLES